MAEVLSRRSIVYDITFNTAGAQKSADAFGAAIKKGDANTAEFSKEIELLKKRLKEVEAELEKARKGADEMASKTLSAAGRLRQIKNELNNFKGTEKQFEALSLEAAKLSDQISNTNKRISILASSTKNIQALTSAFSGLTGVFTAIQGAQALFGKESEDLQKSLVRLQGSMALLQGVQSAVATITEQSAAKTVLMTNAQKLYNFVVGSSTGTLKTFRIALASTGIGLAVIALGALIANWDDFADAVGLSNKKLDESNKLRAEGLKNYTDEITKVELLSAEYNNSNTSQDRRVEIIKELKDLSPSYFGNLSEEKGLFQDLTGEVQKYIKALEIKGITEARAKKISELNVKILEIETASVRRTHREIEIGNKLREERRKLIEANLKDLQALQAFGGDPTVKPVEAEDIIPDGTIKAIEIRINEIKERLQVTNPDSLLFAQLTLQAERLNEELERIKTQFDNIDLAAKEVTKIIDGANNDDTLNVKPEVDVTELQEYGRELLAQSVNSATFAEIIKDNYAELLTAGASTFNTLAGLAKEGSGLQIALAEIAIIADYAKAIASAIAGATSSGAATGPAAIAVTPGFIATLVATTVGAFGASFANLQKAKSLQGGASLSATAFAEGEIDVHRSGEVRGKDSIPAVIMPGESVITTKRTREYKPYLEAIQSGNLEDIIRVNYVEPALALQALAGSKSDSLSIPDYSDRLYRQYLATGEGNLTAKRMLGALSSIDRKLTDKKARHH